MKKKIASLLASVSLVTAMFTVALVPLPAAAAGINVFQNCGGGSTGGQTAPGGAQPQTGSTSGGSDICGAAKQDDFEKLMKNIINTILLVLGMIAVIMIIVGGIRYVLSNGESAQVQAAKNTVLYSVVGLVIAILSYAIVNFVLDAFSK